MTAVLPSLRICGNILSTEIFSYFEFRCAFCDANFNELAPLIEHLQRWHGKREEEQLNQDATTATVNKLEWKAEELKEEEIIYPEDNSEVVEENKDEVDFLRSDGEASEYGGGDYADCSSDPDKVKREDEDEEFLSVANGAAGKAAKRKQVKTKAIGAFAGTRSSSKKLKSFLFDLDHSEYKTISLEFLKLLEARPSLWNTTVKSRHGTKSERIAARNEIKLQLQNLGYSVSDRTIVSTISRILQEHRDAERQATESPNELDERFMLVLENCKFLKDRVEMNPTDKEKNVKRVLRNKVKRIDACSDGDESEEEEIAKKNMRNKPKRGLKNLEKSCSDGDDKVKEEILAENSDEDSGSSECSDSSDCTQKSKIEPTIVSKMKKNGLPYKRIQFLLMGNKIADDFINLLREQPILWDGSNPYYRKRKVRQPIFESWIPHFQQQHNVTFNYDELNENWIDLRRFLTKKIKSLRCLTKKSITLREKLSFFKTKDENQKKKVKLPKARTDDDGPETKKEVVEIVRGKNPKRKEKKIKEPCSNDDDKAVKGEDNRESRADHSDDDSLMSECSDNSNGFGILTTGPEIITSKLKKNNLPFKRIQFLIIGNKIAKDFIDLLHANPEIWNGSTSRYRNQAARRSSIEAWIPHFQQQHNITFSYEDLNENWENLRRFYRNRVDPKHLSKASKALREQLSFLSARKWYQRIKCEHCDSFSMCERSYQNHLFQKHGIGECPYKCAECGGREFRGSNEYRLHMKQVHYGELDYQCRFCDRKFPQRNNLVIHEQLHTGIKINFVCSQCGQSFRRKANLIAHEVRIHLRQRNFACSMCPKAFYTKGLLRDHVNAHLNIRNHKCPTCEKGFHSAHALMRHKQIHTEIKKYACKLCDARFHQFVGLNAHMKNRHQFVSQQQAEDADMDMTQDAQ